MFDKCRRCGRQLRSQRSRDLGYGVWCLRRVIKAVSALNPQPSPIQVEKAFDALLDGAVTRYRSIFKIVSSDGYRRYTVTRSACTCAAGMHDRLCWHRVAVIIAKA
jgi:hypothetical protein